MALSVKRVDTWVASIADKSGALAAKLGILADAGANLEFVIARRAPDKPGTAVVFATPIQGASQVRAAKTAGFAPAKSLHTVRIEGVDKPGQGAGITGALAAAGINLRGLSAASIGKRFVVHVAVDTSATATKAVKVLKKL